MVSRLLCALLAAAFATIPVTLLLLPLWRWLEATCGIESVGHSGPAEWCYIATFIVLATLMALAFIKLGRRKQ